MKYNVHDIKCECATLNKIPLKFRHGRKKKEVKVKGCPHSWIDTPETCMDCKLNLIPSPL